VSAGIDLVPDFQHEFALVSSWSTARSMGYECYSISKLQRCVIIYIPYNKWFCILINRQKHQALTLTMVC